MILLKRKSVHFEIFKRPNIAKLKGIFKLNQFANRYFANMGFSPWLSNKDTQ